ncbi:hypothetical protein HOLleu_22763 [Holothuria leucospilota]|uniref:Uncharacterized protein n=1 Tax=Holothuria leucospilota TaxID=206669 RepID=A0A9Q1BU66_HOLLE|nr:hypothetical protein HOLleu_22763 [Holothuria leucospilota]
MSRSTDKEEFLRDFRRETNECCRALTTHLPGEDENVGQYRPSLPVVREVLGRLTELSRALIYAEEGRLISPEEYDVLSASMNTLVGEVDFKVPETTVHFHSQRVKRRGHRGSPKYNITEGQLRFLVNCRFNKKQIASILHVSVKTVHRRLKYVLSPIHYSYVSRSSSSGEQTSFIQAYLFILC